MITRRRLLSASASLIVARPFIRRSHANLLAMPVTSGGGGGPFLAQAIGISTDTIGVTTASMNTTGANALILLLNTGAVPSTANITDSAGNSWTGTLIIGGGAPPSLFTGIYVKTSPTTSSSYTLNFNDGTAQFPSAVVAAVSGYSSADQSNNATGGTGVNSVQPGSITPTVNNCLVITGLETTGIPSGVTINSSMTISEANAGTSNSIGIGFAYILQTTAAAIDPTWSWTGSGINAGAIICSFKGTF